MIYDLNIPWFFFTRSRSSFKSPNTPTDPHPPNVQPTQQSLLHDPTRGYPRRERIRGKRAVGRDGRDEDLCVQACFAYLRSDWLTETEMADIAGPADARTGLLLLYDIFGFSAQILRGADILAAAGHLVLMPDFFDGRPARVEWYHPVQTAELGEFVRGPGDREKARGRLPGVMREAGEMFPAVRRWGGVGYCWGGKLMALEAGRAGTVFVAGAQTSPAFVDPEDGRGVGIPMAMLASRGEDEGLVRGFDGNVRGEKFLRIYEAEHGFMSARLVAFSLGWDSFLFFFSCSMMELAS